MRVCRLPRLKGKSGIMTRRARKLPEPAANVISKAFGGEYILYHEDTFVTASLTDVPAQVWRARWGEKTPTRVKSKSTSPSRS